MAAKQNNKGGCNPGAESRRQCYLIQYHYAQTMPPPISPPPPSLSAAEYVCMYVCMRVCMHARMYVYIYVSMYLSIYVAM